MLRYLTLSVLQSAFEVLAEQTQEGHDSIEFQFSFWEKLFKVLFSIFRHPTESLDSHLDLSCSNGTQKASKTSAKVELPSSKSSFTTRAANPTGKCI